VFAALPLFPDGSNTVTTKVCTADERPAYVAGLVHGDAAAASRLHTYRKEPTASVLSVPAKLKVALAEAVSAVGWLVINTAGAV
jgi:hypothetical protein